MTGLIGLRCGEVADAVFPSYFDRTQRDKLALALVELAHAIVAPTEQHTPASEIAGAVEGEAK